ncbi:MAG: SDR family NAD(P)-dependent oxidoreductase [Alphaproteobacteria bacterium]|nr:SDR family NAD(P)-dependent oxidoreductase [Alphaproteobacteria bacterium]
MKDLLAKGLSAALGPLLSFERLGYALHARGFDEADLDVDLSGRVFVVTGANSGLGEATARALAARGGELRLLCRDPERGEAARARIAAATGNPAVHLHRVDLADLEQVRRVAGELERVHVLVHNAGVLLDDYAESPQGHELSVAVNLIGPTLLTALLWGKLAAAEHARVVHVSSGGMYGVKLDARRTFEPARPFDGVRAYAYAKRAQLVLNAHLARWGAPLGLACHAMHPGWAETPGVARSLPRFHRVTQSILRTPEQGADTTVWLAAAPDPGPSGRFWADRREQPTNLWPWTRHEPAEEARVLAALFERAGVSEADFRG